MGTYVNEELIKDFISCRRKAFFESKKIAGGKETLGTTYMGMNIVVTSLKYEKINGELSAIFEIHSRNLKERHRILASFFKLILDENGESSRLFVRNLDGELREIHPRLDRAKRVLKEIKEVLEKSEPPFPTFSFSCRNCPFHKECVKFAIETGDISMINGVGEGRKRVLVKAGYRNVNDVARADAKRLSRYLGVSLEEGKRIKLQATALESSSWFLLKEVNLERRRYEYFFDVEKAMGETYLLGVLLRESDRVTYRYFLLEEKWKNGWKDFLNFIRLHPRAPIYHYDVFDRNVVAKFAELSSTRADGVVKRMKDLYRLLHNAFILPVRFYSLKDVARTLGFEWRMEGYTGYEAMRALEEWKRTRDQDLLKKISLYNEDDCRALLEVKDRMEKIARRKHHLT